MILHPTTSGRRLRLGHMLLSSLQLLPRRPTAGSLVIAITSACMIALSGCGEDLVASHTTPAATHSATPTSTAAPTPTSDSVERANALLAQLTLNEKIAL